MFGMNFIGLPIFRLVLQVFPCLMDHIIFNGHSKWCVINLKTRHSMISFRSRCPFYGRKIVGKGVSKLLIAKLNSRKNCNLVTSIWILMALSPLVPGQIENWKSFQTIFNSGICCMGNSWDTLVEWRSILYFLWTLAYIIPLAPCVISLIFQGVLWLFL